MKTTRIFKATSVFLTYSVLLAVVIGTAAFPATARAFSSTIQVDTLADTTVVDSQCSLREAITNSNDNAPTYPECIFGAGPVIIGFGSGLGTATITLTSALPDITHTGGLTIDGGSHITISGNNSFRVFRVIEGVNFGLKNLTVANGKALSFCDSSDDGAGSGVHNDGTLTITNSTFSNNQAVSNGGCGGNGGGLYNGGTATIIRSTFSGNTAARSGGGVYNDATLVITNSTFFSNSVFNFGGGLANRGGTASLTNDTFAFNQAWVSSGGDVYNEHFATLNLYNTILANSSGGGDCVNNTGSVTGINNLIEATGSDACGLTNAVAGNIIGSDPGLASLYAWEPPAYFPLLAGSSAIDAGDDAICAASPVNNASQNGFTRPQGASCDIGSYERDTTPPTVSSSLRANPDPTSANSVTFTVTFSEPVSGVDASDFALTTTGTLSGTAVTGAVGSGAVATVTVQTGAGNGTIRLDVVDDDFIVDGGSNPLGGVGLANGNFVTGQFYTVNKLLSVSSTGTQDGWILELTATSGVGGTMNATATTFQLGDDAANRQYKAILSFNTAGLPDTASISSAVLKIKSYGAVVGTNPFGPLGKLWVDIRQGTFGTAALQLTDFNAVASAMTVAGFSATPVNGWYSAPFTGNGRVKINKTGLTQLRLHFSIGDNHNNIADFMRFLSGNAASGYPQLVISYSVP